MFSKKMKEYIMKYDKEKFTNPKSKIKHYVYMNRMQKGIDEKLNNMLWLAINYPDLFINENKKHKDINGKPQANMRLKTLMLTIKALKPKMDVILVLNNMEIPDNLKTT
jgi:hypothetical protein